MRWLALLVVASFLAGCSSKATEGPDAIEADLGLRATETTGVIRGIIVDPAIRPLAAVDVVLPGTSGGQDRATQTDANGLFGFEGVTPGSHFLRISKVGYTEVQQAVEVKAGDDAPPLVKVQLAAVAGAAPYAQAFKFNGFLECALSVIALCSVFNGPTCGSPAPCTENVTNDNFASLVPIERPPQLIQSEMVWQTTTAASDQLWLWHSRARASDGSYNSSCNCWAQGTSPLLMVSNETRAKEESYGVSNHLYLRVFTGSIEGTRNPLDATQCYPGDPADPVFDALERDSDVYCGGAGFSVEQGFTIYTHVFYGYLPPAGWRFSEQQEVPAPQ